ncbi:MAG: TonB-dependent receptor [Pseudomonadota bacterium]
MSFRISCALCCVLATPIAFAQSDSELDEIVVKGTKTEQSLFEVTDSVSVVTAEEIEREPVADLYDIVERIPNVTSAFGEQGFAIRGVDQRGIGGGGSGLTITTYVDDAPLGNQTTFFGPTGSWDVEQIEVFRGPQSTNFGRNALAGAIYIRTRDPSFESDFRVRAEIADADTYQLSVAGGGALVEDTIAVRLSADYRESEGFIDNTFLGQPADESELTNFRLKFLFTPSEDIRIVTTTTYAENFAGEDIVPILATDNFIDEVQYDTPGREGTETYLHAINFNWALSDAWAIQSITTLQNTNYLRIEDFDVSPAPIAALDRTGSDDAISQEFRVKYSGERLSGALGFYYVDVEDSFDDEFIVPASLLNPAIPPTLLIQRQSVFAQEAENFAIFGDFRYELTDRLSVLFGARFDEESSAETAVSTTTFVTPIPPGFEFLRAFEGSDASQTAADFDAFLPKIGLQWGATESSNIALVVQRGYRAGGSELSILDGTAVDFDPEFITNYELSTRSLLLDGRLSINANIFYADWEDQQVPVPIDANIPELTQTVNAGQSSVSGLELEFDFRVDNSLDIYGSLGHVISEFEDFPLTNPVTGITSNLGGNRFPFAAEWSANVGFAKFHEWGLFYGMDVNYRDEVFTTNENEGFNVVPERTLVNARLGYDMNDTYRVTLYARNLLDDDNIQFLNRPAVDQIGTARFGNPRQLGLRVDATF